MSAIKKGKWAGRRCHLGPNSLLVFFLQFRVQLSISMNMQFWLIDGILQYQFSCQWARTWEFWLIDGIRDSLFFSFIILGRNIHPFFRDGSIAFPPSWSGTVPSAHHSAITWYSVGTFYQILRVRIFFNHGTHFACLLMTRSPLELWSHEVTEKIQHF